jgi:ribosomal protein L19E
MASYRFKCDRCGRKKGTVVDGGELREGIVRTLIQLGVLEKLDDNKLDDKKNFKPAKSGSKSGRGKGSPKSGGKRSGRTDSSAD